ncbi:MAG: alanine dehydrogenase [Deltaproteobacteria bacterium]|jgi:alanine dehydrogenase|nr:alanine dehydrogenase [Deltaproteobacteria bacterium]
MRIGIPKEIKTNENRVAITPAGVAALAAAGHSVFVQSTAGLGSGITDQEFAAAGATLLPDPAEVWGKAELALKVKEPLPEEYQYMRKDLTLFTYLHLAPEAELTRAMLASGMVGIAYETVQLSSGALPLLEPMSEVAGKLAVQFGAYFLCKFDVGGAGVLLGGVPGVPAGRVAIIGGGVVGAKAAKIAVGMGAQVTVLDVRLDRLRYLADIFGSRLSTVASSPHTVAEAVRDSDLVVGAVLFPGARAPQLVTEEMVKSMRSGSVLVDVAIDQGGCIATMDHVTTHKDPVFMKHGVIHYSVPNMPGAVPRTSTFALTNATLPYVLQLAGKGWQAACRENAALAKGVNIANGACTYAAVAEAQNLGYTPIEKLL